jgi:hypothetical protein
MAGYGTKRSVNVALQESAIDDFCDEGSFAVTQ